MMKQQVLRLLFEDQCAGGKSECGGWEEEERKKLKIDEACTEGFFFCCWRRVGVSTCKLREF